MKFAIFFILCTGMLICAGCTGLATRSTSTQALVERQLQLTEKIVFFSSTLSPEVIRSRMLQQTCGTGNKNFSTIASAGPGLFVNVSNTFHFTVESGAWLDGSLWVALRMEDAFLSAAPSGVKLVPRADGGSDVSVLAADARKVSTIKQRVEEGALFCHWREFDYPDD